MFLISMVTLSKYVPLENLHIRHCFSILRYELCTKISLDLQKFLFCVCFIGLAGLQKRRRKKYVQHLSIGTKFDV